jgi:hypothetical protein
MSHSIQNFDYHEGNTTALNFTVRDPAGAVVDISLASEIRWSLAAKPSDAVALIEKRLGAGVTITDGPNGKFQVAMLTGDTAGLANKYYHDARVTLSGSPNIVASGKARIFPTLPA